MRTAERALGLNRRGRPFPHKLSRSVAACLLAVFSITVASAQTITGTVTNGTTNKPSAGDGVILLSLGQGMQESGRTQTDAKGNFTLKLDDTNGPHLIRAVHQGVTYHRMAPPGTTSVEVQVFDVAKKVQGLSVTADVMRFQAQGNELQGIRLFAVNNASNPPRTQMNEPSFEFYLPDGAEVDQAMAMTAGGQPLNSSAVPQKEKNRYGFIFPLRPGETQFQVVYHMPYTGSVSVNPRAIYDSQHFVVMLPKTMQFKAGEGAKFQQMQDPQQSDATVEVASNTTVGQVLDFSISGAGLLSQGSGEGQTQGPGGETSGAETARDSRPGGGLGPPIDAPDPLEKYRWYILGGFGLVLAAGGIYVVQRSQNRPMTSSVPVEIAVVEPPPARKARSGDQGAVLFQALKEELFQLEIDHNQGQISRQEYEKAKAALDETLKRALKREGRVTSAAR
jgi:hypothetical protein